MTYRNETRFSWRQEPELMARLVAAQNHEAHAMVQDILTIVGFFSSRDELVRHVEFAEARVARWEAK